ncbi:MAG: hypothetical protein ACYDH6_23785 [Acidimicrobiales bacterium]
MIRAALAAVLVAVLVACGGGRGLDLRGTSGSKIAHAADVVVPDTVLGLAVKPEDVTKTVALIQRAYIDSLVLYGLRQDNLLEATLQISRFNPGTRYRTPKFRQAIADQLGSQVPITATVGGQTVYVTAGNRQRLSVWFKGSYLFVLATRQDYPMARSLLRQLLAINP